MVSWSGMCSRHVHLLSEMSFPCSGVEGEGEGGSLGWECSSPLATPGLLCSAEEPALSSEGKPTCSRRGIFLSHTPLQEKTDPLVRKPGDQGHHPASRGWLFSACSGQTPRASSRESATISCRPARSSAGGTAEMHAVPELVADRADFDSSSCVALGKGLSLTPAP